MSTVTSMKTTARAPVELWLAGGAALASGVALMVWFWRGGLPYDSTSGVWAALADDVAHGDFYREVQGTVGYGGTRYMPLFFSVHGALIHAGYSATGSGLALTIASLVLLATGAWGLMRRLGVRATVAWPVVALLPASIAVQLLMVAVKGDLLAAALNVWGLTIALGAAEPGSRRTARFAGMVLAIAVLTKFTAVFAFVTLVIWWTRRRNFAVLRELVTGMFAVMVGGLALGWWLSAGRIAEAFAVCATGGVNAGYAWKFPWWFALTAAQDPFFLALFAAAAAVAVRRWRRDGLDFAGLYFAVTAAATVLIFVSPGTDSNHLVDLLVASVTLLALEISDGQLAVRSVRLVTALLVAGLAAAWLPGALSVRHFFEARGRPTLAAVEEISRRLPPGTADRMLAENPLVPIALGRRPEVLDCFSLRLLAARSPAVRTEFLGKISARRYAAVVLVDWSGKPDAARWAEVEAHTSPGAEHFYGDVHFPAGFLEALHANYRLSFVVSPFVVFEPLSP
jgi:hypothetical protein